MTGFPQDAISRIARIEAALDRIFDSGLYTSRTQSEINAIRVELAALKDRPDVAALPAV